MIAALLSREIFSIKFQRDYPAPALRSPALMQRR
jgi:hypothetical protein